VSVKTCVDLEGKMRSLKNMFRKQIAAMLILWVAIPACKAGSATAQERQQSAPSSPAAVSENALPDSPQPAEQNPQPANPQPDPGQPQDKSPKPVGTAAAPYERTMGIAASRPAGAAIAPAKQRRVRTILISVGVIVGAGIAVGSVAALSHGSPSRP
jgi:hypothetical protein